MTRSIFVTGGTGFIGRSVMDRLQSAGFDRITCLVRPGARGIPGATSVTGDLLEPSSYAGALDSSTVVLHLAAATGKATAQEHHRVNVHGTEALLQACRERQVSRFVFVSSIAAKYGDLRSYPYGRAKRAAEGSVRQSSLDAIVIRPTIVLGDESPIWLRFRQMASGSVVPLIGSGNTRVQPIHVNDVADALVRIAQSGSQDRVIDLGGPETTSLVDLLRRIHRIRKSDGPRFVRVPYAPIRAALHLLEPVAHGFLPVTAGQLSVFVNDSTVDPTDTLRALWPQMMTIDQMLNLLECRIV